MEDQGNKIYQVNNILRNYNWQFIHPYMQVYKINSILDRYTANNLTTDFVTDFFINDFYDLGNTLSSIDGYFKRSQYFEPFCYFIENSLILCFQRDYAGAINIIIPCIEGIMANYLEASESINLSRDRFNKIKAATDILKRKLVNQAETQLSELAIKDPQYVYNRQRTEYIVKQERKYYDDWFDAIEKFLKDSLFAHSDTLKPGIELNRHSILHSLELKQYDTLENYIKLFNCLRFLAWVFLQLEKKSILNNIDDTTFLKKMLMYEDMIRKSETLLQQKGILLKDYALYNPHNFRKKIIPNGLYAKSSQKLKLLFRMKTWLIKFTER